MRTVMGKSGHWLCHRCVGYVPIALAYCPRCADATRVLGCDECLALGSRCPTHGDPVQREPVGLLKASTGGDP